MTTYTETDLITEAYRAPGLIGIEETPSAAEVADAQVSNSSVIATMNTIGIPIWNGSVIDIPEEYFIELAMRLSLPLQFKNGMIDHATYLSLVDASEARLTVMAAPRGSSPLIAPTNESTGPSWWPQTMSVVT